MPSAGWRFWIDQGGTFTDLVAQSPQGELHSIKVLTQTAGGAVDAIRSGMEQLAGGRRLDALLPEIAAVQIGTTLGTNALLEGSTAPTALLITQGFGDALAIGHQQRPDLFSLRIHRPPPLYSHVLEVPERLSADGEVLTPLQLSAVEPELRALAAQGVEAVAICLLHSWCNGEHERMLAELAKDIGFAHISVSHQVLPQIRLIGRGGTTVANAGLTPVIERSFRPLCEQLARADIPVHFMQSDGHLVEAARFRGCDSVLSGPAGGVNGGVGLARQQGMEQVIGFDMGGTSTDVWHWAGELERRREVEIAGCHLLTPTLDVHSIAAGGGSVLTRSAGRLRVGPQSAGAQPGPACYGLGGPPTITDANFCVGYLQPSFFPAVFGPAGDALPDAESARRALASLASEGEEAATLAAAFLSVACDQMAQAIRRISMERGFDPAESVLLCLGGAAGQHCCRIADRLEMKRILAHPFTGVLSALGVGLARPGGVLRRTLHLRLDSAGSAGRLMQVVQGLQDELAQSLAAEGSAIQGASPDTLQFSHRVALLYQGSDAPLDMALPLPKIDVAELQHRFAEEHLRRYGYRQSEPVVVESVSVEASAEGGLDWSRLQLAAQSGNSGLPDNARMLVDGEMVDAPVLAAQALGSEAVSAPALIVHPQFSLNLQPGWRAQRVEDGGILLEKDRSRSGLVSAAADGKMRQRARLELFIGLFRNVAEKMGVAIRKTAASVNIRERMDYSCALFNAAGELIANAPHMPVHIGSMSESVRALIADAAARDHAFAEGEFYAGNNPYHGGTHLPDITVVTPLVADGGAVFFLAVRGHHAEIGGVEPGSMPADSRHIEQEGVLLRNLLIAERGRFLQEEVRQVLTAGEWPSRNPELNLRDLQAQIAACSTGVEEMRGLIQRYGLQEVGHWADRVLDSGEEAVRHLLKSLRPGSARCFAGNGEELQVRIAPDVQQGRLLVDFSGSASASNDNFNAPLSVTRACVLYVLRCLVREDMPLNEGCMRPVDLVVPDACMLSARYPAAVAAGNVETSQAVAGLLLSALGVQAGAQGTMNNLTFGNDEFQYYETLGGGSGAGADYPGADAVHTHMTNSRLTDPEILESRFPVRVERFAIRRGSGGAGARSGGNGMIRQIRFLTDVRCSLITSGREAGGRGMDGGGDGAAGRNLHLAADGEQTELQARARLSAAAGEALCLQTPGGGGFGRKK